MPLHSSLGNKSETPSQKKRKRKDNQAKKNAGGERSRSYSGRLQQGEDLAEVLQLYANILKVALASLEVMGGRTGGGRFSKT